MREFTCVVCGRKGIDRSGRNNQKFCSEECAQKARYCKSEEHPCKYNQGVGCIVQKCSKCGWNPEVEQIRKEKLEKEYCHG